MPVFNHPYSKKHGVLFVGFVFFFRQNFLCFRKFLCLLLLILFLHASKKSLALFALPVSNIYTCKIPLSLLFSRLRSFSSPHKLGAPFPSSSFWPFSGHTPANPCLWGAQNWLWLDTQKSKQLNASTYSYKAFFNLLILNLYDGGVYIYQSGLVWRESTSWGSHPMLQRQPQN